ncbi:MAG: glycerol-3-phosphate dehydrogenase [Hyphomicrobium sp.]|uniref:glycerol-3-phosphate dehydrogenase n=1 Tax=Hyphomicrobium sp. TaxID=82 RepID=UPI003D102FDB
MRGDVFDLAIVGGGINGAGLAADAAGRGLKVVLFEKDDLASGTSSASSKLIHGGLRYLEHFELRLVRESLAEREVLLARAPHLVRPLRFVIPLVDGMRSGVLMRLGLFLYDHLAQRKHIPASGSVDLARDPMGRPLRDELTRGLAYYDCSVDDARLVVTVARDAAERGARIFTRAPVTRLRGAGDVWEVTATSASGRPTTVAARVLVNAAGPWCADVARLARPGTASPPLRLVRGTHIVVPRIAGAEDAYLLQNADGRVVFALPFEELFTMIGTTDVSVATPGDGFVPSADEEAYLIAAADAYFARPPRANSIAWRFAGVRALVDDGQRNASAMSREYRLDLVRSRDEPPLLNIIGGKITTYRRLAEAVLAKVRPFFPGMGAAWTASSPLPGGEAGVGGMADFRAEMARRHAGLSRTVLMRLVSLYGTRADRVIGDARSDADLGAGIGGGVTEREAVYLRDHEWARTAEDVLWRRTKAGLHLHADERREVEEALTRLL